VALPAGVLAIVAFVAILLGILVLTTRRRKSMSQLPIGVGDAAMQQRFIAANKEFLLEHAALHRLVEKVGLRTLAAPAPEEVDQLLKLPEDDPAAGAFEDKVMADRAMFGLGRIIADDFGELLTLCGNGYGIGAYKILRGMYEQLVTAAYIAKYPSEARPFVEDDPIKKWKLWQQAIEVSNISGSPPLAATPPSGADLWPTLGEFRSWARNVD
jgi:hypothetical protein